MPLAQAETIIVGDFSNSDLTGWISQVFEGETRYQLEHVEGLSVLSASSSKAASGLFTEVDIDLNKTPIIHWSWKIKNTLASANERAKSGDDFSARVYVVFSDGPFFWQTKTLSYVWANQSAIGQHWPNPYTVNAQMLAVQSGEELSNRWRSESRNILQDIQRVFGKTITTIEAVAIMTDTDQTGAVAQAWYGDIWFSD
ncbi:MAG: DUF3047 domain-containing protein [Cycloclasticus sp.]